MDENSTLYYLINTTDDFETEQLMFDFKGIDDELNAFFCRCTDFEPSQHVIDKILAAI